MTYNEFIQNIIETRGQHAGVEDVYCEKHHIKPKCCGGTNEQSNLILLTEDEHREAHKLLAEEQPENDKLILAYHTMMTLPTGERCIDTNDPRLAQSREMYSKVVKKRWEENNPMHNPEIVRKVSNKLKGIKRTPEHCAKLKLINLGRVQTKESNEKRSKTMLEHKLLWYTNGVDEVRSSECPKGWHKGRKPISEETREKYRQRPKLVGEKNGMYGKHNSPESNKARSEWSSKRRWFNNGKQEMFIIPSECVPGWKPGRLPRNMWGKK